MGGSRLRVASLIATFVILAVPGSALAHAELQRSIPDNGETPATVTRIAGVCAGAGEPISPASPEA